MKQLWKRLVAHVKLAANDLHAKTIGLSTFIIAGVHDFLTTADMNAVARWNGRQWFFHGLKILGAPLIAWLATARAHQDGTAIATKLRASGYGIDALPQSQTQPQAQVPQVRSVPVGPAQP